MKKAYRVNDLSTLEMKRRKRGFTLIELLIVIAIIGILSSVVLVSLSSARDKAKFSKVLSTMQSLNSVAYSCMLNGTPLNQPVANGVGGSALCATESATLPNISDTNFIYCGGGCGGWNSDGSSYYFFSAYSSSYPGGIKIVFCAAGGDFTGLYGGVTSWDFRGINGCKTYGF